MRRRYALKRVALILLLAMLLLAFSSCGAEGGREYAVDDYRTTMEFHDNFRILQLTDLHLGIESDLEEQLNLVRETIRAEAPDLIVLTGDNFMYASKDVVRRLMETLNEECRLQTEAHPERLTKFAVTYGNHDNQGNYGRYFINETVLSFATEDGKEVEEGKYAAFLDYEDDNLFGLTNYFIDLVDNRTAPKDEQDVIYRLHIVDSNTYYFAGFKYKYDVIHEEQLAHVERIYETATKDKEYIGLCFFHIPFMEYADAKEQYESAEDPSLVGQGRFGERVLPPYENNGTYRAMRSAGVIGFFAGHNHKNYGDVLYTGEEGELSILSNGVKSTDQLYHFDDMIGYKVICLREGMTAESFLTIENINENFKNVTAGNDYYEDHE